jgi:succinoglycan biosynthesis protein ExoM
MRSISDTDSSDQEQVPLVTIVIPTFRRADLLHQCLASCMKQKGLGRGIAEILVVDNSPERSAEALVNELEPSAAWSLRYVHEPNPGISNARNAGFTHARGEFIAFIDDDETASEGWLQSLLLTQAQTNADVVLGPVLPALPSTSGVSCEAVKDNMSRTARYPTGTEIASSLLTPFWARGQKAYPRLGSGNSLIRRRAAEAKGLRFDPGLGLTGGEDTLYLNQLWSEGAHFVWCAEAAVSEHIPPERLSLRDAAKRAFREGQTVSLTPILLKPSRPAFTALSMTIALIQVPAYAVLAVANTAMLSSRRHRYLINMMSAVGKLLWASPFRMQAYGTSMPKQE